MEPLGERVASSCPLALAQLPQGCVVTVCRAGRAKGSREPPDPDEMRGCSQSAETSQVRKETPQHPGQLRVTVASSTSWGAIRPSII